MKKIKNLFALLLLIGVPFGVVFAQDTFSVTESLNATIGLVNTADASIRKDLNDNAASSLNFTIAIPVAWQSQIVRVDYENQSIFSLNTGDKSPAFLFSVTKVTGDQWMKLKSQVKAYTIIENKDGFITFVEKTDVKKMLPEVDAMIRSINIK